ncbi:MAG: Gp37 family protein [Candidatus Edwardsbacteria bacterium]|nr:Gp37 family protein [Candidatus Edwardsbacteria bacterium]
MGIKAIEDAVYDRLNGFIKDLAVEAYPDNPDLYELKHAKGSVMVHFEGATAGQPERRGTMVQREDLNFGITVMVRSLKRNTSGAYDVIDLIKQALAGHKISGCGKIYLRGTALVQIVDGVWEYSVGITVPTVMIINQEQT